MRVALATAAGVHLKSDKRFNLAGDTTYREVPDTSKVRGFDGFSRWL